MDTRLSDLTGRVSDAEPREQAAPAQRPPQAEAGAPGREPRRPADAQLEVDGRAGDAVEHGQVEALERGSGMSEPAPIDLAAIERAADTLPVGLADWLDRDGLIRDVRALCAEVRRLRAGNDRLHGR